MSVSISNLQWNRMGSGHLTGLPEGGSHWQPSYTGRPWIHRLTQSLQDDTSLTWITCSKRQRILQKNRYNIRELSYNVKAARHATHHKISFCCSLQPPLYWCPLRLTAHHIWDVATKGYQPNSKFIILTPFDAYRELEVSHLYTLWTFLTWPSLPQFAPVCPRMPQVGPESWRLSV